MLDFAKRCARASTKPVFFALPPLTMAPDGRGTVPTSPPVVVCLSKHTCLLKPYINNSNNIRSLDNITPVQCYDATSGEGGINNNNHKNNTREK